MELIPVFPPIDESTWANSVVGILINFIPLLNILDANPATSPVIPPPIDIKKLIGMIKSGKIIDSKTISAVMIYAAKKKLL